MRRPQQTINGGKAQAKNLPYFFPPVLVLFCAFLFGCVVSGSIVLHIFLAARNSTPGPQDESSFLHHRLSLHPQPSQRLSSRILEQNQNTPPTHAVLQDVRILVILVAFDFSQIPHLEEVLDAYHDVAVSGAKQVDVVVHSTVAYPVLWIDMWNDRFNSPYFSLTIRIKPPSLRLHLVDCHREEFYKNIDNYDLFIYSEDDIRVTPTTVATYLLETKRIEMLVANSKYKPEDFNVGIVRYEYNYPSNVVIDDKTRHATQNVTRVYWEHSGFERPVVPNAVYAAPQEPLSNMYVSMKNHHQGMYLATSSLLKAWKTRCNFHIPTNRPGKGSQPTEGTQRVWMSSQMLYGGRHCNVQQVLPTHTFGTLTVLHLPNKNYRRVGKYRNRVFSDGTEVFERPHPSLLQAMELHLALKQAFPKHVEGSGLRDLSKEYRGIRMVDEVDRPFDRTHVLERRMKEYNAYVQRGGVLSAIDMTQRTLEDD